ncbi:orotidine 5'-phosphate decarboxylase / HUMPS family protein [Secundilactobacillus kimchicus]|uniref:orotidine 5'-phosphate decarboxylase / HUMPS family protein n=1 Tax=Secundilactobacillus kimchicus TaxID=528209 RepID=UPI0024A9F9D1|nr:orotidine 5'-phosphate decarboxylase / HUMPS family protein [Secundilactobacillus kimchicus]
MKLQAAIDRVSLDKALDLVAKFDGVVDIIELGTSIIKDYGMETLKAQNLKLSNATLLLDIKTNDEGVYEFKKGYAVPADILTVMASSSNETIEQVYELSEAQGKTTFIDLLGVTNDRVAELKHLENAIFGLHHSKDTGGNFDAVATVADFHQEFPEIKHVAVAGGIDLDQAHKLAEQGIAEVAIVGGKISGADDPVASAKQFMEAIK